MAQTETVHKALLSQHPEHQYEITAMATAGDKNQSVPLHDFGAKALWTTELEAGLMDKSLDVIVHCLKDLPTQLPVGCEIGCIMEREDPRDALIVKKGLGYKSLKDLPDGAVVGTSSVRRMAQVRMRYPRLSFKDVRGNIKLRLEKLDKEDGDYDALVLAAAGLLRMDWGDRITQYLDTSVEEGGMLHAVGQGALALEVREGDEEVMALVKGLQDEKSMLAGLAERSLMRTLEGGCSIPLGVETTWVEKGKLLMKAIVVSLDGKEYVEAQRLDEILTAKDSDEFGWKLAQDLVENGTTPLLEAIKLNRPIIEQQGGA